ncbi:MAG: rRNA maturation RNase YbeY, partial [Bacteroidota bacterium]
MTFPDADSKDKIHFHYTNENIESVPNEAEKMILNIIISEQKELTQLTYVLCDDAYLLDLNIRHLNHDTLTDIITFPMSDEGIDGEIYISVERVLENAKLFDTTFKEEFLRVIAHGVLH